MLQLEYCTRPLDVLHRSWTMLMLDKKTIAVRPFVATLIPEPQGFLIAPTKHGRFRLLQFLMLLLLQASSRT